MTRGLPAGYLRVTSCQKLYDQFFKTSRTSANPVTIMTLLYAIMTRVIRGNRVSFIHLMTLLWHYYDTIMTLLWHPLWHPLWQGDYYDTIMTLLWHYYDTIIIMLLHYYHIIMTLYNYIMTLLWHYYDTIIPIMTGYKLPVFRNVQTAVFYLNTV